jgi:hypothetical protein
LVEGVQEKKGQGKLSLAPNLLLVTLDKGQMTKSLGTNLKQIES